MDTETIEHQFKGQDFYIPNWDVKHLFVGTFNPAGGEKVNYFYGRSKNQTWKLISEIFSVEFDPRSKDFLNLLKENKIACVDMIDKVIAPKETIENIIGKGYKDPAIINNSVERVYNTNLINNLIKENKGVKVYSTWGKGSTLKEWTNEVEKLGEIIQLTSPSMAAKVPKGEKKFDYMLSDWKNQIY